MTTLTKSPKARKPQPRTMQFIQTGFVSLLWITQGKKTDGYQVEDTSDYTNADGRTFRLTKTNGEQYDVLIDGPSSECTCIGFEHRGMDIRGGSGCKHIAALTKLQQLGKI